MIGEVRDRDNDDSDVQGATARGKRHGGSSAGVRALVVGRESSAWSKAVAFTDLSPVTEKQGKYKNVENAA